MALGTKSLALGPKSLLTSLHMICTTEDWERLVCPDTWCVAVFLAECSHISSVCMHFGLRLTCLQSVACVYHSLLSDVSSPPFVQLYQEIHLVVCLNVQH